MNATNLVANVEVRLAVALAVGMLIGAERERLQVGQGTSSFAGLRTFGLAPSLQTKARPESWSAVSGALASNVGRTALLASLSANSLTKVLLAFSGRHMTFGLSVSLAVLLVALSAWLGLFVSA